MLTSQNRETRELIYTWLMIGGSKKLVIEIMNCRPYQSLEGTNGMCQLTS